MSNGVNKAIIVGRLGNDPEIRHSSNGNAIANLSVATSESWKDKNSGQKQEKTEWHRIVAFGKLAEIMGQYLNKGSQVYIEGKLQTRKWQDNNGQDRYTTEIVADQMRMLGGNGDNDRNKQQHQQNSAQQSAPAPGGNMDDFDDDIPF